MTKFGGMAAAIAVIAVCTAGCSVQRAAHAASAITMSVGAGTPVQAAQTWFAAINGKDRRAARAAFVPADREQADWLNQDSAEWSTFTSVDCKALSQTATAATVVCTFKESASPTEGNPDSFWNVEFQRQSDGRWLIAGYGQG